MERLFKPWPPSVPWLERVMENSDVISHGLKSRSTFWRLSQAGALPLRGYKHSQISRNPTSFEKEVGALEARAVVRRLAARLFHEPPR